MDKNSDIHINPNGIPGPQVNQPSHRWSHLKQFASQRVADASRIPNVQLKIVFITHVFLVSLAGMGAWAVSPYLFYNVILILTLMWGIHKHTNVEEPLFMAMVLNAVFIFLDIVLLSMRFPNYYQPPSEKFFASVGIIHLLIRPVVMLVLYKLWQQQVLSPVIHQNLAAAKIYAYEDMDKPSTPAYSHLYQAGFNFSRAQQL